MPEDDAVARGQRLAVGVGRDALAECGHVARPLVALVPRAGTVSVAALAQIAVHVRAADVGQGHLDQQAARRWLRHRVFAELEDLGRSIRCLVHHCATSRWHWSTSGQACHAPDHLSCRKR